VVSPWQQNPQRAHSKMSEIWQDCVVLSFMARKNAGPQGPTLSKKKKGNSHRSLSVADDITEYRNINTEFLRCFFPFLFIRSMEENLKVGRDGQPTVIDQFAL